MKIVKLLPKTAEEWEKTLGVSAGTIVLKDGNELIFKDEKLVTPEVIDKIKLITKIDPVVDTV